MRAVKYPAHAITLGPWTLAQSNSTGPGLAPLTLPVWTVEPWFGIGFHSAQLSSVLRVLLSPILDGFARHAWLGPRTTDRAKLSNTDWAHAKLTVGRRCVHYCPIVDWPLVPGPRA